MAHLARETAPITPPHVLIQADKRAVDPIMVAAPRTAWRMVSWLGLLLAIVGGVDIVLRWYPVAFKSPEWEFGTVALTIASFPVFTIGTVALLGSYLARANRTGVAVMAVLFGLLFLFLCGCVLVFLLDVPLALRVANAQITLELKKTIIRTVVMGCAFATMYAAGSLVSFRYLFRRIKDA